MSYNHRLFLLHSLSQTSFRYLSSPELSLVCTEPSLLERPRSVCSQDELKKIAGSLDDKSLLPFMERSIANAELHLSQAESRHAWLLTCDDSRYPAALRSIPDPPLCLTCIGEASLLEKPCVAIVGARKATPKGREESYQLAKHLALRGYTIVSGGALGCDSAAHRGALDSGVRPCPTIVVFAGGLNALYPRMNHELFQALLKAGALLVSERLMFQPAVKRDFPIRNRIVAGLSREVVVIQAAESSGAMITARLGLNYGREVRTLIQDRWDVRIAGNLRLLAQGAPGFDSADAYVKQSFAGFRGLAAEEL